MAYKLYIFDADGTLRRCTIPGQPCPNREGEWELLPNVKETLSRYDWGDPADGKVAFGIASNQAGISYGFLSSFVAFKMLVATGCAAIDSLLLPLPGSIAMCCHRPDEGCSCRKPEPGLLISLMYRMRVPPEETLFVGDKESDKQAAENAGCAFMWAKDFFGW